MNTITRVYRAVVWMGAASELPRLNPLGVQDPSGLPVQSSTAIQVGRFVARLHSYGRFNICLSKGVGDGPLSRHLPRPFVRAGWVGERITNRTRAHTIPQE